MKRYIYIIIGIVVAAVIAILVLLFIKNNAANPSGGTPGTNATTTGTLPVTGTQGGNGSGTVGTGANPPGPISLPPSNGATSSVPVSASNQMTVQSFGVLSNNPVLDYFVDSKNTITAIEPSGEIVAVSNGQSTTVNASTTDGIFSASFSFDGRRIVANYGNPANPQTEVFGAASGTWTAMSQTMESPQWSPINNYQIAYLTPASGGRTSLAVIDASNIKKGATVLFTLNATDLALQWPTANQFILSDKPTSQNAGSVWVFNSQAGTLTPLMYEVPGAEGIWSHNAGIPYGLTFFNNPGNQGNTLQLQAISGNLPTQPLTLLTLPSKCAFNTEQMSVAPATTTGTSTASSTATKKTTVATATSTPYLALYCGIPRSSSGFSAANLPDDYNMMALFTSDDIYKVNTATGASQVLWSDNTQNVDASDVKFFNNALFFINRYDQRLYGLTFSF